VEELLGVECHQLPLQVIPVEMVKERRDRAMALLGFKLLHQQAIRFHVRLVPTDFPVEAMVRHLVRMLVEQVQQRVRASVKTRTLA